MGVYDVWEIFEQNPNKWFTREDIQKKINSKNNSVTTALRKLRKQKTIYKNTIYKGKYKRAMDIIRKYKLVPKNKDVIHYPKKDKLIDKGK